MWKYPFEESCYGAIAAKCELADGLGWALDARRPRAGDLEDARPTRVKRERIATIGRRLDCMLADDEIHLWMLDNPEQLCSYPKASLRLLSEAEEAEASRFFFEHDRARFRATRAMLRNVLSRYVASKPQTLRFVRSAYGKPEIAADQNVCGLTFNLSHTQGLVVIALARGRRIGVDTEKMKLRERGMDAALCQFNQTEVDALKALPPEAQMERFYALWTLKEAFTKAVGLGLRLPFDQFGFDLGPVGLRMFVVGDLPFQPADWRYWRWRSTGAHVVALCVEAAAQENLRVLARRWIGVDGLRILESEVSPMRRLPDGNF